MHVRPSLGSVASPPAPQEGQSKHSSACSRPPPPPVMCSRWSRASSQQGTTGNTRHAVGAARPASGSRPSSYGRTFASAWLRSWLAGAALFSGPRPPSSASSRALGPSSLAGPPFACQRDQGHTPRDRAFGAALSFIFPRPSPPTEDTVMNGLSVTRSQRPPSPPASSCSDGAACTACASPGRRSCHCEAGQTSTPEPFYLGAGPIIKPQLVRSCT